MISPYFPPRKRVGSLRAFKFAKYLPSFNIEPTIVCLETPNDTLSDEEKLSLANCKIVSLSHPFDLTTSRSSSQLTWTEHEELNSKTTNGRTSSFFADILDNWFPIDTWLPLLLSHRKYVYDIAIQNKCTLIWSTGDPWSSHIVAGYVAKRLKLPWIVDFRDPWTLCNLRYNNRPRLIRILDKWAERRVINRADWLVFTAESTQAVYAENYSESKAKFSTIYNSFDIQDFSQSDKSELPSPKQSPESVEYPDSDVQSGSASHLKREKSRFNILFFGRFRELSPATPILNILSEVKRIQPDVIDKIRLMYFGELRQEDGRIAKELDLLENLHQQEPVPHDQSRELLNQADLLLLSTDPSRNEIIPAKLWDYLPSTTPILNIAPNPEIKSILDKTKRGVSFDPTDLKNTAQFIIDKVNESKFIATQSKFTSTIEQYHSMNTTKQLAQLMKSVTNNRTA